MFRTNGMPRGQGCAGAASFRLARCLAQGCAGAVMFRMNGTPRAQDAQERCLSIWHRVILPAWAQRSCGTLLRTRREPLPGASGATSMSLTVLSKVPHTLCYLRNHSSLVSTNYARWSAGVGAGSNYPPQRPPPKRETGNCQDKLPKP